MAELRVADAHVDVLWKMDEEGAAFYPGGPGKSVLQAGYLNLKAGGVQTQVFALFVSSKLSPTQQLETVLRQVDAFYRYVVRGGCVRAVRNLQDLRLARSADELAGLLSLEGAGCLRGQISLLRILYDLGIRGVGLTWNDANELAYGCGEAGGGGLTEAGRAVVREMGRLGMWTDLAHLSDAGVADVFRTTDGPVMASHANVRAVHPHRRNLTDDTIREMIRRDGWIGLTFEASFVGEPANVVPHDVFRHLDRILDMGGESCVGFGSDFDGTSHHIPGLSNASDYRSFSEQVCERYGSALGERLLFGNFERFLERVL